VTRWDREVVASACVTSSDDRARPHGDDAVDEEAARWTARDHHLSQGERLLHGREQHLVALEEDGLHAAAPHLFPERLHASSTTNGRTIGRS